MGIKEGRIYGKKGGCGTAIIIILVIFLLMSCGRSGADPTKDDSSNTTQGTEKATTEIDNRESRYINAIAGEWMYRQTSLNEDEIHFIFNPDRTGYKWMNDSEPKPFKYIVTEMNPEGTKAWLVCEGETVNDYFPIDISNLSNGTIRKFEYEMWHPGDR